MIGYHHTMISITSSEYENYGLLERGSPVTNEVYFCQIQTYLEMYLSGVSWHRNELH